MEGGAALSGALSRAGGPGPPAESFSAPPGESGPGHREAGAPLHRRRAVLQSAPSCLATAVATPVRGSLPDQRTASSVEEP